MKNNIIKLVALTLVAMPLVQSCSADYLADLNTDKTKPTTIDPNAQLTTGLLQTYGDFDMMDTYRCYITGFTQHFAGGWNVSNYAGSVHFDNDMSRKVWDRLYSVSIKNLTDAIMRTPEQKNVNALLRIHRAYLFAVLTDAYGDIPCSEAGLGYFQQISNPKYDTQEEVYNFIFEELDACIKQIAEGATDVVTGDVSCYAGDLKSWARYANSLRMRYAMRISDVAPEKAREEFQKSLDAPCGYISNLDQNAYIKYTDSPFTLYQGAEKFDFRVNALGEMLYGQDSDSPTFVCATFFNLMKDMSDPRLYRICRHYLNPKRSSVKADDEWNVDVTDEVRAFQNSAEGQLPEGQQYACVVGAAWWHNWINAPSNDKIPTLERLVAQYPDAGFDKANYNVRMLRPFLSIKLEKANCPGVLMTSAEVNFLLAEAVLLGWVSGSMQEYYEKGIADAMKMLNSYYEIPTISDSEIAAYIAANPLGANPKESINTQAYILHLMNPMEAWANLRRSGYPILEDRAKYEKYPNDFTYDDENLTTPVRLKYPNLEAKYNKQSYDEAIARMGGKDDWHKRVWWDVAENVVK